MSISYAVQVNVVSDLFSVRPSHNQVFQTLGYSQKGIGGNLYRYDSGSSATIDGGFVLPGIGGTLSFSGTTFNGVTGNGRFIAVNQNIVDIAQFGAVSGDSTNSIVRASAAATLHSLQIYGDGVFTISSTITLTCNGDLSRVTLNVDASSVSPAVVVGNVSGSGSAARLLLNLKLPQVINTSKSGAGWAGFDTSVGVDVANLYESTISVQQISGFGVGLWVGGYTSGNVYNTYNLQSLTENKVNLKLGAKSINGWCNQNTFIGGRYYYSSSEGVAVTGVRQILLEGYTGSAIAPPNNNVFINPSIEGDEPEFHVDINGAFNTFLNPRFEVPSGSGRIRFYSATSGDTANNLFIGGYKFGNNAITYDGALSPGNCCIGSRTSDSLDYTGNGLNITNRTSSGESAPHIQGFESDQDAISKTSSSTNWTYRLYGNGVSFKNAADTNARAKITSGGVLYLGPGSIAANAYMYGGDGVLNFKGWLLPDTNEVGVFGTNSRHIADVVSKKFSLASGSTLQTTWTAGTGSPQGSVTANVGSLYTRTDGGTSTTLYVKESGTGNTGWVAK